MRFDAIYGVDFSGAKEAGRNIWIARIERTGPRPRLRLAELDCAEALCGQCDRAPALEWLVRQIAASFGAIWGIDFPFGLPIEIYGGGSNWPRQIAHVAAWPGGAHEFGLECVNRAKHLGGAMHIRRTTDNEVKTPFDCYHYRIIYQTFHGMRDVLRPLAAARDTAILPFQYRRLATAKRVVVEACPGSTLKRLGLPHQNYKQPAGGALSVVRLRTRRAIVSALATRVDISAAHRRIMMRNGGGDALDALIAAVGTIDAWGAADHLAIARHPRYPREGRIYC